MGIADWDFGLLESLIADRGDFVIHETAVACPICRNEDPLASSVEVDNRPGHIRSLACGTCQGNGYIYRNPRRITGLVTAIRQADHQLTEVGYVSPGDCVFSPSLHVGFIGDFDRITFTNPTQVDSGQVIRRGMATHGQNIHLSTDLATNEDRLWYTPESVQWCEDQHGVVYYPQADFVIAANKIQWINSPEPGTRYTIKYRAYMEWIAYTSPMERYDRGRSLAQRVSLRKKHVYFMNGLPTGT